MKFTRLFAILLGSVLFAACASNVSSLPATRGVPPTVTPIPWHVPSERIASANANRLGRIGSISGNSVTVNRIMFSHDNKSMLTQDGNGRVMSWDLVTGLRRFTLNGTGAVLTAFYTPDDSQIVTIGADNHISLWKAADGSLINTVLGEASGVTASTYSADGGVMIVGNNDGMVNVWQPSNAQSSTFSVQGKPGSLVRALAFAPDGKIFASIATDDKALVWDAATRTTKTVLTGFSSPPLQTAFSADSSMIAIATGTEIHIYNTSDYQRRAVFTRPDMAAARGMAFSPDGRFIAAGSTGDYVYVWNIPENKLSARLPGHDGQFTGLAWSPDGQLLLTTSPTQKGGAYVWNTETFKPDTDTYSRGQVSSPSETIYMATWSPDSKLLITADARGNLTVWGITGK